jgi:hypothetical protein
MARTRAGAGTFLLIITRLGHIQNDGNTPVAARAPVRGRPIRLAARLHPKVQRSLDFW